jgi:putative PIN family toxin of toxin-antitoxin system
MKQSKVFLDSSVIIAGLASKTGGSHEILALAELGLIIPYISEDVVKEVLRNVQDKLPNCKAYFYSLFKTLTFKLVDASDKDLEYAKALINEKDAAILAAAISGKVDWLISLDKHFLIMNWKGKLDFVICSPGDFLQELILYQN